MQTIVVSTCSARRCERESHAARAALAAAYAREAALVHRFEAVVKNPGERYDPVLASEVNEALDARDRAIARLGEWSP